MLKISSFRLLITLSMMAALTGSAANAFDRGPDKRPSYCLASEPPMIAFKAPWVASTARRAGSYDDRYEQTQAEKMCIEFKIANPSADCRVNDVSTGGDSGYCWKRVEFFRVPTFVERTQAICAQVADCLGKAFAKDDRGGLDWASEMSSKLGCQ